MASVAPAESLNTKFDNLGKKFDNFYTQIPVSSKNLIQKTISDWQDWYYSDIYGNWPGAPLIKWNEAYKLVSELLEGSIKKKNLKPKEPKVYEAKTKVEVKIPTIVYGKTPKSTLIWIVIGSAATGGLLYSLNHLR